MHGRHLRINISLKNQELQQYRLQTNRPCGVQTFYIYNVLDPAPAA
jgi:hypothetical protein